MKSVPGKIRGLGQRKMRYLALHTPKIPGEAPRYEYQLEYQPGTPQGPGHSRLTVLALEISILCGGDFEATGVTSSGHTSLWSGERGPGACAHRMATAGGLVSASLTLGAEPPRQLILHVEVSQVLVLSAPWSLNGEPLLHVPRNESLRAGQVCRRGVEAGALGAPQRPPPLQPGQPAPLQPGEAARPAGDPPRHIAGRGTVPPAPVRAAAALGDRPRDVCPTLP